MSVIYDKRSMVRRSQLVHLLRYAQPDAAIELLRPDAEAGRAEVFAELAVIAAEARPAGVRAWLSRLVDTPDAAAMVWAGRQLEERTRSDAGELYRSAAAVGSPAALARPHRAVCRSRIRRLGGEARRIEGPRRHDRGGARAGANGPGAGHPPQPGGGIGRTRVVGRLLILLADRDPRSR